MTLPPPQPPQPLPLETFTTPDELEDGWRPLTDAEAEAAPKRLEDALTHIRAELPELDALVLDGALSAEVVSLVLRDMVRRSFQVPGELPSGASSVSWSTGPFSTQVGLSEASRDGSLYLSRGNRRALGIGRARAWAVDMI